MEIVNIESSIGQHTRLSERSGIALTCDTGDLANFLSQELLVEGFCLVLVESGRASFCIGSDECHLEAGEVMIVNYGQCMSNMMISPMMKFRAFFLCRDFVESLISRQSLSWTLRSGILYFSHLQYRPGEGELRNLFHYYDLLDNKRQQTLHQQQGIDALCEAFGYEMLDQMERHGFLDNGMAVQTLGAHGAAHQHFDAFMNLLLSADVVDRTVSHYADQLNISAKYLNLICHQVTQLSPSALIDRELLQRATRLLRESSLSIKQIAHQLGFSNQSHFGTFMRRVAGKSPQQLRNEEQ